MNNLLLDNFYTELSSDFSPENQDNFKCVIRLDPTHPVYKGHFPQIPIAPGVCLTQIIKEVLSQKIQSGLVIHSADNIKFLAMVNPNETPELELNYSVKKNGFILDVTASFSKNTTTFVKFKGKFNILS